MSLFVQAGRPALVLAPMEGVTDAPMRAFLSERGGFTYCVAEFLRISHSLPGHRFYAEHVPELLSGSRTASGTPVQVQLLGGDPEMLAQAALRAVEAGALGIDLNFGCPAKTVNRHDGGATLLKHPERIRAIVSAVRAALPAEIPVSAKLRLGWDTRDPIHHNADMAAQGGASWITIHGRTKSQGYMPPVYWEPIGEVRRRLGIPVVANGDIWSFEDFLRCRDVTGSEHFMIGRSALANPHLQWQIARELGIPGGREVGEFGGEPSDWIPLFERYMEITRPENPLLGGASHPESSYTLRRIKQWLRLGNDWERKPWFTALKRAERLDDAFAILRAPSQGSLQSSPSSAIL